MENIKIESSWNSDTIKKECGCATSSLIDVKYIVRQSCGGWDPNRILDFKDSAYRLFSSTLYAMKYPDIIITKVEANDLRGINIFDVIKNKIIFSSIDILKEEKFSYNSTFMMETFMIMKYESSSYNYYSTNTGYIIYNFETQEHSLFMNYDLLINNDRSMFVFYNHIKNDKHNRPVSPETEIKIITKSDINKVITITISIDSILECICNPNILLYKSYLKYDTSKYLTNYYDIKKQKTVYVSENQFIGWRGNRFIEYDNKLRKCNLISFINEIVTSVVIKEYKNCKRCLDKFMSEDEICDECKTN